MTGKKAWNRGLTKSSDERLSRMAEKLSVIAKEDFRSGKRDVRGERNPNFGNTRETFSQEKRENFSRAAAKRIIDGVAGYGLGCLNGMYDGKKAKHPVRFKSSWELTAMMFWDNCDDVLMYEYEPRVYVIDDGRRTIPDFLVTLKSGDQIVYEIKPSAIQDIADVSSKLALTKIAVESDGKKYVLIGNAEYQLMLRSLGESIVDEIKKYKSGKQDLHADYPQ